MFFIKKTARIVVVSFIFCLILFQGVYANETLTKKQQSEATAKALENVINLIMENYYNDVTAEQLYEGAVFGMSLALDEYSQYMTSSDVAEFLNIMDGISNGLGFYFEESGGFFKVVEFTENSKTKKAGMLLGDVLVKIGSYDVTEENITLISEELSKLKTVDIIVNRNNNKLTFKIAMETTRVSSVGNNTFNQIYKDGKQTIGYVSISIIDNYTFDDFKATIQYLKNKNVNKIILDLRDNPGGTLEGAIKVAQLIVPEGLIISTLDSKGVKTEYKSSLKENPFERMVVLVNADTASSAEIISSALQDSGSTIVGEITYGKGLAQSMFNLYNEDALKMTVAEFFRRNGQKVNGVGVVPNVQVAMPKYINNIQQVDVTNVKFMLSYLGYQPTTGEILDEVTSEEIKKFQKNQSISETGIVDVETAVKLNKSLYDSITKNDLALKKAYDIIASN